MKVSDLCFKVNGSLQKEIARHLGVSEPTISRELKRNSGQKGYRHKQASEKAAKRRHNASHRPKKMTAAVIQLVEEKLAQKFSPEQIAGVLRSSEIFISYESIIGTFGPTKGRRKPV